MARSGNGSNLSLLLLSFVFCLLLLLVDLSALSSSRLGGGSIVIIEPCLRPSSSAVFSLSALEGDISNVLIGDLFPSLLPGRRGTPNWHFKSSQPSKSTPADVSIDASVCELGSSGSDTRRTEPSIVRIRRTVGAAAEDEAMYAIRVSNNKTTMMKLIDGTGSPLHTTWIRNGHLGCEFSVYSI